jgi:hypothetical protein
MKKVAFIMFIVTILLCSCSRKEDTDYPEFSRTKWGMSMDETLNAFGIMEKDTSYYKDGSVFTIKGYELFGEKTSEIIFNFIDLKNGNPVLCAVKATYPEITDMNYVLKKMQKAYGKTVSDITIYDLFQVFEDKIPEKRYTESEHLKLWASRSVIQSIPDKELENYRDRWENYQTGLNDENWDTFSQNARMVTVVWSDNGEFPSLKKNSLAFNAFNLVVYNEIKSQLSDQ